MSTVEFEDDLRDAVGRLVAERCAPERVAALADAGEAADRELWDELAVMGLPGLATPEEHGGAGLGHASAAAAQEELGRGLALVPSVSTFAVQAGLLAAGDLPQARHWLPRLASGEVAGAVAAGRTVDGWTAAEGVRAARASGGWTLNGEVPVVADALAAGVLLVAAGDERGLFLVEREAVAVEPVESLDPTRPLGAVVLRDAPGEAVAGPERAAGILAAAERAALVMLAADAVGVAARALDMAVEYARTRRQFGRPIGSFQAVSHRCADMLVAVESGRALVAAAAEALDAPPGGPAADDTAVAVDLAAAHALDAAVSVTGGCVQIHGGMGFTWEHPAHRYLRRAKAAQSLVALPDRLRDRAVGGLR
jgi:alkylation response protein AidB-like acyl-CoA dehydrogenase